ncbi:putative glycoside hydrolase [Haladaptatus halobius]|uniref:putative glycoside hydrolase n=1 Tax=Haladaptatus halobius TaxID=2884875 RepID=UPI001D0A3E9F|nr:putative glycoside hydrolase [Haladaptatus halobius]
MSGLWTYPWTLNRDGLNDAFYDLAAREIDTAACATHYHSVRSLQPRHPDTIFETFSGGCYFDPESERFSGIPIDPIPNEIGDLEDPLADIVAAANDHGVDVAAWTVCLHNSRLGEQNPDYRQEDVFGTPHNHAFCPSNPEVQQYFRAVTEAATARGVVEVQLESVGFQSVFHGHDMAFGHDKRQILTSSTEEWLFSQCFCDACRDRARDYHVDINRAQTLVKDLIGDSFDHPHSNPPSLDALIQEHPTMADLFDFRATVVTDLMAAIADGAGSSDVNYYVMDGFGSEPGDGWPAGIRLNELESYLNRITALCYVANPSVAAERVRRLQRIIDIPVDGGVTLNPSLVECERDLHGQVDAIREQTDGRVQVYNHSLATMTQMDWIERALATE